jgi:hypothetical protein
METKQTDQEFILYMVIVNIVCMYSIEELTQEFIVCLKKWKTFSVFL